jgi:hypothetical protein
MTPIDLKEATIKIVGGGGSGQELEVQMGEGTFNYTTNDAYIYRKDRGRLSNVSRDDEAPMDITWEGVYQYTSSAGTEDPTIEEALKNLKFSGGSWVTLGWDTTEDRVGYECDPYCVDVVVTYTPDCTTGITSPDETKTFKRFRVETCNVDMSNGTINISGRCNALRPEAVRS